MPTRLTPEIHVQDHVEGPTSARVTLVEYGDFECPYSAEAVTTVQALLARLGEDLRFVYRHFPLVHKHPHAFRAAGYPKRPDSNINFGRYTTCCSHTTTR
jgi:hypothetical protein